MMNPRVGLRSTALRVLAAAALLAAWTGAAPSAAAPKGAAAKKVRPPTPGIYFNEELTSRDAARLDRDTTIVLQPVGLAHPHGPHLPLGTDNLIAEALVRRTAEKIRAQNPGYTVLILPLVPIGTGPSNELGYIYNLAGTVTTSRRVVEAALVDLAINFANNSWRNFFFVSFHHDPSEYRLLTDVSQFLHEAYGMAAANVTSLVLADSAFLADAGKLKGAPKDSVAVTMELHGGSAETSLLLAVAPDRVEPDYRTVPALPVSSWKDIAKTARKMGWLYYYGNPGAATAEYGRGLLDLLADHQARMILSTMADHMFVHDRPGFEDALKTEFDLREIVRSSEAYEVKSHAKYQAWLRARLQKETPPPSGASPGSNR